MITQRNKFVKLNMAESGGNDPHPAKPNEAFIGRSPNLWDSLSNHRQIIPKLIKLNRFLVTLGMTVLLLLFVPTMFAQSSSPSANVATPSAQVNYQPLDTSTLTPQSPQYANLIVNNLLHAFSCLMAGQSPIGQPCVDYLHGVPVISSANTSGGLLGAVASLNTIVIANPPIRTGQYLATIGDSLGLVKPVYAQVGGSGEGVLRPILTLWQVSRNIAYVFMIIIFVVIGLMVMFRTRINPQTVISLQAALPGLVIGLIMITFSYFLASLITDTAYLGTNLVGFYFTAAQGNPATDLVERGAPENVLSIFGKFTRVLGRDDTTGAVAAVWDGLPGEVASLLSAAAGLLAFQFMSGLVPGQIPLGGPIVGAIALGITAGNPQAIIGLVLWAIAIGALIYAMLKLLLRLINNYLAIIFLTITAPFHFLVASLPGRQGIAADWIRNMLCNVLAFPAVLAVLYFVAYLLGPIKAPTFFQISATGSVANTAALPLFGGLDLNFIRILLAYGALVATPAIPDIICRVIGKVGTAEQLIGQEIAAASRGGQGYAQRMVGAGQNVVGTIGGQFRSEVTGIKPMPGGAAGEELRRTLSPWQRIKRGIWY